jgi:ribokinase
MDVTCVGDVNVDVLTSNLLRLPQRDSQVLLDDLQLTTGGCAANTAKALAILGAKTRLIGKIGDDIYGDFVRKDFGGIHNLKFALAKGSRTGATIALTFKDKTRSFLTYPGGNCEFTIKDLDYDLIEGKCLHVASFFLQGMREKTKRILDYAHQEGMITSFDAGFDPRGWRKQDLTLVRRILKDVDIFFPNLGEGQAITGKKNKDKVVDELLSLGVGIIALKLGSKGCYVCTEKKRTFVPAYKVKALDTTGAGDVFAAGFIYAYLKAWDMGKCARFASAAAALKTRGYGSWKYPKYSEVMRIL